MSKFEGAYKTIGEVVRIIGLKSKKGQSIPTHTIRYWEKEFKQIKPKILNGNRRYYNQKNIELLKKVHFLLKEQGMTINGVKKALNDNHSLNLDDFSNKSISIETFNIGIPMRDEPNELLDCGNPFNTTIGDNTMEFYKANQLSDPLLLADNTYLFNGDNMLDPIHSNIDSSHGTELSVKCDQGDPHYRYSPYSSANRVQFRQLDGSSLQDQIATITCNAPIGLPDTMMNILRTGPPRRREEPPDPAIGTNLRTCVISGCHSNFIELVDYELSLPPRMSMYSYENYGLCWMPLSLKEPSMFINFLLNITIQTK